MIDMYMNVRPRLLFTGALEFSQLGDSSYARSFSLLLCCGRQKMLSASLGCCFYSSRVIIIAENPGARSSVTKLLLRLLIVKLREGAMHGYWLNIKSQRNTGWVLALYFAIPSLYFARVGFGILASKDEKTGLSNLLNCVCVAVEIHCVHQVLL